MVCLRVFNSKEARLSHLQAQPKNAAVRGPAVERLHRGCTLAWQVALQLHRQCTGSIGRHSASGAGGPVRAPGGPPPPRAGGGAQIPPGLGARPDARSLGRPSRPGPARPGPPPGAG
jgi:hypothetical protein